MSTTIAVIVALAFLLVAFVASRPNSFRLERSTVISAPASAIYPLIADFHRWTVWSPFEKMDAEGTLKRTYNGADSGLGALYNWDGPKTGSGGMEILEAEPDRRLLIKLDFTRPFEAHNMAEFILVPDAGGTRVTWAMYGPQSFMLKLMSLVFSSDKMMGPVFEEGLRDMKAAAEAA